MLAITRRKNIDVPRKVENNRVKIINNKRTKKTIKIKNTIPKTINRHDLTN